MRPKLIRRRRRFPCNRICLSDTPRSRAFIGPRLDSSTNYFREINIKRAVVAPDDLRKIHRAKRETDMFDDYLVKRGEMSPRCAANAWHPLAISRAFAFAL